MPMDTNLLSEYNMKTLIPWNIILGVVLLIFSESIEFIENGKRTIKPTEFASQLKLKIVFQLSFNLISYAFFYFCNLSAKIKSGVFLIFCFSILFSLINWDLIYMLFILYIYAMYNYNLQKKPVTENKKQNHKVKNKSFVFLKYLFRWFSIFSFFFYDLDNFVNSFSYFIFSLFVIETFIFFVFKQFLLTFFNQDDLVKSRIDSKPSKTQPLKKIQIVKKLEYKNKCYDSRTFLTTEEYNAQKEKTTNDQLNSLNLYLKSKTQSELLILASKINNNEKLAEFLG